MRFVVICAPRTGSSHLVNRLSGHPEVFANGNIFDSRRNERLYVFWPEKDLVPRARAELLRLRENDPWQFMEQVLSKDYGRKCVGFKIFDKENDAVLHRIIEDTSIKKVILFRRNVLANFSSTLIAKETRKYGLKEGGVSERAPRVMFCASEFVDFHNRYIAFFEKTLGALSDANQNCCVFNYEDLNEAHLFGNLLSFIGADPTKEIPKEAQHKIHLKQNSSDIMARFLNRDAVEGFLAKRSLLHWSHEGELNFSPLASLDHPDPSSDQVDQLPR